MKDYTEDYRQLAENSQRLQDYSSDVKQGFKTLHTASFKEGALDKKQKEFVALGIAIAERCEGCILSHVRTCLSMGVTIEEIAGVVDVAIAMGGGPATVYGAKALEVATYLLEKE